jgi:hypothetical protein
MPSEKYLPFVSLMGVKVLLRLQADADERIMRYRSHVERIKKAKDKIQKSDVFRGLELISPSHQQAKNIERHSYLH